MEMKYATIYSMNSPIVGIYGVRPEERSYIEKRFADLAMGHEKTTSASGKTGLTIECHTETIGPENIPAKNDARAICVFVDSVVNGSVMDAFPDLKFIAVRATGYDNVDLSETRKRGITVSNVPSYGENTVAEFAFGLILSLSRKIYTAADQIKETGSFKLDGLRGFDLMGKTLGTIGTGHIGAHSIRMAKGFGMNVIAYDPFPNEKLRKELGFEYVPFDTLLSSSDVITIHVPYSKETHHLIDRAALSRMKKTTILVNTSRGGIIDTEALVAALNEKTIAGAGLDVLEEEGVIKDELAFISGGHPEEHNLRTVLEDHALIKMPNVIITPHNAFNTDEALKRILDTTVENIRGWSDGKPANVVK